MPWLPKKLQNVMAVTDCVALYWQPNPISVGRANPECRGDGHEKEFVPCRPDLACDRLVCVRRWRRSLDPLYLSAASGVGCYDPFMTSYRSSCSQTNMEGKPFLAAGNLCNCLSCCQLRKIAR